MTDFTTATRILAAEEQAPATRVRGYWQNVGYRLRYDYVTLAFALVIVLIVALAVFAPWIAPKDPYKTSMAFRLKPVGFRDFLLGTDELGRDILSRLIHGGRMSLLMGVVPVVFATLIGGFLGVLAGFIGGKLNMAIMRTMDVFYAFPSILLAVAISGAMGGGMMNGMVALTLVFIPPLCRIAETATTQVRGLDFVEAARASGGSTRSIIATHILGNVLGPIFIYASGLVSVSILIASGLSFLGLGVQPPDADWGALVRENIGGLPFGAAAVMVPSVAIASLTIAVNLLIDNLPQKIRDRSE